MIFTHKFRLHMAIQIIICTQYITRMNFKRLKKHRSSFWGVKKKASIIIVKCTTHHYSHTESPQQYIQFCFVRTRVRFVSKSPWQRPVNFQHQHSLCPRPQQSVRGCGGGEWDSFLEPALWVLTQYVTDVDWRTHKLCKSSNLTVHDRKTFDQLCWSSDKSGLGRRISLVGRDIVQRS